MAMEIEVVAWDRDRNVTGLNFKPTRKFEIFVH